MSQNIEKSQIIGAWQTVFDFNPTNEPMMNDDGRQVPDSALKMLEGIFNKLENTQKFNKDGTVQFSANIAGKSVSKMGTWELKGDTIITAVGTVIEKDVIEKYGESEMMINRNGLGQLTKWVRVKK